ncbi:unnamed protein product [Rotaria magnacalcarata]|uniref:NAD(P)(+)--arginine ADP-ribosyltransferase n=1 Tax=Rotaria magnacalcarata TaxID=392030 RepID=A0A816MJ88_9BILA|nr:unnamed protein product [Rotaria magnacalcarata]CAF4930977.1 unnamed protein product [Rotaria magnacalcarata]
MKQLLEDIQKPEQNEVGFQGADETPVIAAERPVERDCDNLAETLPTRQSIEWQRKPNNIRCSSSETDEWHSYSDVEVIIIEEAFQKRLKQALLDNYYIDFENFIEISYNNPEDQRVVKRTLKKRTMLGLMNDRFSQNPITPSTSFTKRLLADREPFFNAFYKHINLSDSLNLLSDGAKLGLLLEKAAQGLIIEAKHAGKQKEGEWMAQQLLTVTTLEEAWKCCARLYCMESFLYKKLNECMRLVGEEKHEAVSKSKVPTFGPLAFLLRSPKNSNATENITVHRGANLSNDQIEQYRNNIPNGTERRYAQFPAFTSSSRSRPKAEQFANNALFIIEISSFDGRDVSPYSNFDEEEQLIDPYFSFYIRSCNFVEVNNRWEIHLQSA